MKSIVFFLMALILLLNVNVMAYDLIEPKKDIREWKKQWRRQWGYPTPVETGEKLLLKKNGYLAESIVYLINGNYETVRDEMRKIVAGKMGIASENETVTNEYIKSLSTLTRDAELESIRRREFNELNTMGIKIGKFRQYKMETNKYNKIKKYSAYSVLVVKIIDGRDVFNKECTLIVMTRTDHWRDWAREHNTNIWIPIKGWGEKEVITNTEIGMAEELKDRIEIKDLKYFIPESKYFPLLNVDMMKAIKEEVDKS